MRPAFHWSALLDQPTHRMVMRYHPEVGHLYVPGLVARMPHHRGGYLIRTNDMGFRSDVEFEPRRTGKPRILVFGDSFTDGQGCDNHERYSDCLAELLGASVYNYGLSGSAPDQQLLIYERLAHDVEADLIIWGIAVHNIERIKHTHRPSTDRMSGRPVLVPKPYFTLDAARLTLHHVPVPRVRPAFREGEERDFLDEPGDPLLATSLHLPQVYAAVRRIFNRRFPNVKHHLRSAIYRAANIQGNEDYSDAESPGWQLLSALVRRFAASAKGTPILVVPLPTYHYWVDKVRPLYDPLFAALADPPSGLHVFPITERLARSRSLAERRQGFEWEAHYSPFGHEAVAQLISGEIRRLGLIPPAPAPAGRASGKAPSRRNVLGMSFGERGGAAVLVREGAVVAGGVEDVFARRCDRGGFPDLAANYCLEEGGIHQGDLAAAGRARSTAALVGCRVAWAAAERSERAWSDVVGGWVRDEMRTDTALQEHLKYNGPALEVPYGAAHCASALYASPFNRTAILSLHDSADGTVATVARGEGSRVRVVKELPGLNGLGDLARTVARLLDLPAREPFLELAELAEGGAGHHTEAVLRGVVTIRDDGGFVIKSLDEGFLAGSLGIAQSAGIAGWEIKRDAAASVIAVAVELVRRLAASVQRETGESHLCLIGEVFQVPAIVAAASGAAPFAGLWVHKLTGHASAALGAALLTWQRAYGGPERSSAGVRDACGPAFSSEEVRAFLDTHDLPFRELLASKALLKDMLKGGSLVGVFGGRLCLTGPTAGSRGILVKEDPGGVSRGLDAHRDRDGLGTATALPVEAEGLVAEFADDLREKGDDLISLPLRLRGEPVALTPYDAYHCMMEGQMDAVVIGDSVVLKSDQPTWVRNRSRSTGPGLTLNADEVLGVQRWIRKRAPHGIPRSAESAAPGWVSTDYDATDLCITLMRTPSDQVPDHLVSRVPPGRMRAAVAGLLRDTFRRPE